MVVSKVCFHFIYFFIWYILLVITITTRPCSHILHDLSFIATDKHRSPLGHKENNWFLPVQFTLQRSLEVWCSELRDVLYVVTAYRKGPCVIVQQHNTLNCRKCHFVYFKYVETIIFIKGTV